MFDEIGTILYLLQPTSLAGRFTGFDAIIKFFQNYSQMFFIESDLGQVFPPNAT